MSVSLSVCMLSGVAALRSSVCSQPASGKLTSCPLVLVAAPCYEADAPFGKIDVLSECLSSVQPQLSKARNGCTAYAEGWEAGDYTCDKCGRVDRRFRPCDLGECIALCTELYGEDSETGAGYCMGGCYRYDFLLIDKLRTRGSPSTGVNVLLTTTCSSIAVIIDHSVCYQVCVIRHYLTHNHRLCT